MEQNVSKTGTGTDPLVGDVLDGRYEVLQRLARGGMATVYRAWDRRLERIVAVKVMHEGLGDDAACCGGDDGGDDREEEGCRDGFQAWTVAMHAEGRKWCKSEIEG